MDRREFGIVGQGGKERVIFLSDSAAEWLEKYLETRKMDGFKPLFIRYQGHIEIKNDGEKMRLTSRSIERIVEKVSNDESTIYAQDTPPPKLLPYLQYQ